MNVLILKLYVFFFIHKSCVIDKLNFEVGLDRKIDPVYILKMTNLKIQSTFYI